ncbi:hypothetical protein V8E53_008113 [Lactarius tabidus]
MPSSSATPKTPNPVTLGPPKPPSFDIAGEERVLLVQDIVDEVLVHGVWITRARRLRGRTS